MPCNWLWPLTRRMDLRLPIPKPRVRFFKVSPPWRQQSSNIRTPFRANRKPATRLHLIHFVRMKIGFGDRTVGGGNDNQVSVGNRVVAFNQRRSFGPVAGGFV